MELIERDGFLELLQKRLSMVAEGEGHCIFVSGEAGIGKTALVKAFCKQHKLTALFTREHVMRYLHPARWRPYMILFGRWTAIFCRPVIRSNNALNCF